MEKMRGDDPAHGIDNHGSSSNVGPDQGSSSDKQASASASATASKRSSKSNHVNSAGGGQPRDASRKGRSSAASGGSGLFGGGLSPSKDELICKMESDIKKLKVDLQLSRNQENDLRDQIVSFMTGKSLTTCFLK